MIKRVEQIFFMGIVFILLAMTSVSAETVIGSVYESGTRAYIDGMPIPVYTYNGLPYIVAEDLNGYGFQVSWDANTDTVDIAVDENKSVYPYDETALVIPRGNKIGDIYSSTTAVRLQGEYIGAYSMGGRMLVSLDDFYRCGNVNWYAESNTIALTTSSMMNALPDWQTLMPAYYLYTNISAAGVKTASICSGMIQELENGIPTWGSWGFYNTRQYFDSAYRNDLVYISTYLRQAADVLEPQNAFYYKSSFYHTIYTGISIADNLIKLYDVMNGHSYAYIFTNSEAILRDTTYLWDELSQKTDTLLSYIEPFI